MNEATNIGQWVLAAAVILNMALMLKKFSGSPERREISPQPLEVKEAERFAPREHLHPQYISRDDCREMHHQQRQGHAERFDGLQRQLDHLNNTFTKGLAAHNQQAEERVSAIHSRINQIVPAVSAIDAKLESHISHRGAHA